VYDGRIHKFLNSGGLIKPLCIPQKGCVGDNNSCPKRMAKFDWNKSIKIAPPYAAQRALLDGMPQK